MNQRLHAAKNLGLGIRVDRRFRLVKSDLEVLRVFGNARRRGRHEHTGEPVTPRFAGWQAIAQGKQGVHGEGSCQPLKRGMLVRARRAELSLRLPAESPGQLPRAELGQRMRATGHSTGLAHGSRSRGLIPAIPFWIQVLFPWAHGGLLSRSDMRSNLCLILNAMHRV